jgi:hypothetical protein
MVVVLCSFTQAAARLPLLAILSCLPGMQQLVDVVAT